MNQQEENKKKKQQEQRQGKARNGKLCAYVQFTLSR